MPSNVFISHSSKDQAIADGICKHLESAGMKCWIAPRDIEVGSDWTKGIMRGIASCRVLVVVFTAHANDSEHVGREVAKAFSMGLAVIPFRIEAINPGENLGYFLGTVQWLDATIPPWQKHLGALNERVKQLLANGSESGAAVPEKKAEPIQPKSSKRRLWVAGVGLAATAAVIAAAIWFFISQNRQAQQTAVTQVVTPIPEKSIAVLPFESLSENKSDTYFADGVQDEILSNVARISQLKVISRTSVMQYRADTKRDLRQIANALGVANILEGTVRRATNRVRITIELVDARTDQTIWSESYDRDLTDIFAIQSEVAQTIASKLTATLSPEEKKRIEAKPTENLEAYDLYLRGKELVLNTQVNAIFGDVSESLREAVALLEQAVRLDPKFTLAYCASAEAHDILYHLVDQTPERRALADAAVKNALRTQPDLPEVRLAYAHYLYFVYLDYDQAWVQLTIARRGLPNDAEAVLLAALMDRRQGNFEKAIQEFNEAIKLDPHSTFSIAELSHTLVITRQFRAAEQVYNRLIELFPDQPMLKLDWATSALLQSGDDASVRSLLAALPTSMADDKDVLSSWLDLALTGRDWIQAKELIDRMNSSEEADDFAYGGVSVPFDCYSILLTRLQGEQAIANSRSDETRELLNQKVQKSPENARLLSQLAVLDALLSNKEAAISEAKRAIEMLPISKDAVFGPGMVMNLAVVYAWTNEPDLAFGALDPLAKMPGGIYYGELKLDPYWEPLRKDPRYEKLLAELAPRD
jgi:TolB-like protein/Flp pilus assembly protein TadD